MNDEIKYWLEGLDDLSYTKVLDYITNLQQENERLERLKNTYKILSLNNFRKKDDYKNRCEKAIEELKTANVDIDSVRLCEIIEYAIHILQNGSDSQ